MLLCGDDSLSPHARCASLHFWECMEVNKGDEGDEVQKKIITTSNMPPEDSFEQTLWGALVHRISRVFDHAWFVYAEVTAEMEASHSGVESGADQQSCKGNKMSTPPIESSKSGVELG